MGLDVHILPIENVITIDKLEKDTNLIVEDGDNMTYIKLSDCPESAIGLYSKEEIVDYGRVWGKSLKVMKYIAETYDALLGADGFFDDAGYEAVMEGMRCEDEEQLTALTVVYYIDEMLRYEDEYEWSYEFKGRLKELREIHLPIYEKIDKEKLV